ncbi:hypothetical protein PS645_01384 [Pseudomonas fluorescens]|uniref:Lipoprotein n=1 Tax=Pseudomonas fluorescens TaxID=294 RepID=A0A5E6R3R7_PSEFL|nr:hypothetical protein [Pseudomonas fluorescens]VVM63374.1 hypothetical protein PS645_01384 [Pseudomonas fluorescens]
MYRIAIAFTLAALVSGCSSTPVDQSTAKKVPAARTLAYQANVPGGATLIISRDNGFWASGGCMATVLVDGKKAARIDTGEVVRFEVKPGRHIVGIAGDDNGKGLCAMQIGQPVKEIATDVAAGEVQRFRISGTQSGTDIRPSSI